MTAHTDVSTVIWHTQATQISTADICGAGKSNAGSCTQMPAGRGVWKPGGIC